MNASAKSIYDYDNGVSAELRGLAQAFMSKDGGSQRYLFGRNEHSLALSKVIEFDGFIDDYAEPNVHWNGKPVVKLDAIPKDAIVVNCVLAIRPKTAERRIRTSGFSNTLSYRDLQFSFPDIIPLPGFVLSSRAYFESNPENFTRLYDSLADEHSKKVLSDIVKFRMSADLAWMRDYDFRIEQQYFEDFLGLDNGEIFVDVGAYDGFTTKQFAAMCPNYEKIYLFEPSSSNMEKAKITLRDFWSVEFIEKGVSDIVGSLRFDSNAGSASAVAESGSCQIDVTSLDSEIEKKVTFIKMDIEGWELKALEGARRHILEDHPKLAIAAYHNTPDFWRIFEFVISLRSDYDVYLRHYTEGWTETIMYFVPK